MFRKCVSLSVVTVMILSVFACGGAAPAEEEEEVTDVVVLQELASQPPVVKLLNLILLQAVKDRASDIHFEPFEDKYMIRYELSLKE